VKPHAGLLKEVVDWYAPVREKTAIGQTRPTYSQESINRRAMWVPTTGTELDEHGQQVPVNMGYFRIRNRTVLGLSAGWKAEWAGREYEVVSVFPLDGDWEDWLQVMVRERAGVT
jgi:hypothetical protein